MHWAKLTLLCLLVRVGLQVSSLSLSLCLSGSNPTPTKIILESSRTQARSHSIVLIFITVVSSRITHALCVLFLTFSMSSNLATTDTSKTTSELHDRSSVLTSGEKRSRKMNPDAPAEKSKGQEKNDPEDVEEEGAVRPVVYLEGLRLHLVTAT